jgi:hypothetical protein
MSELASETTASTTNANLQLNENEKYVVKVYIDFLAAYQKSYPESFIVLIGDK